MYATPPPPCFFLYQIWLWHPVKLSLAVQESSEKILREQKKKAAMKKKQQAKDDTKEAKVQ